MKQQTPIARSAVARRDTTSVCGFRERVSRTIGAHQIRHRTSGHCLAYLEVRTSQAGRRSVLYSPLASIILRFRGEIAQTTAETKKAFVLEAFDLLFNKREFEAAERYWSPHYFQHSPHIEPGLDGQST
jgi:hypothetical protein